MVELVQPSVDAPECGVQLCGDLGPVRGHHQSAYGIAGRRQLTIPAKLAYGDRGAGRAIKPGETLIFVVDLLGVR